MEDKKGGMKIRQDNGKEDTSSGIANGKESHEGRSMGGGVNNLSHTLPGKSSK